MSKIGHLRSAVPMSQERAAAAGGEEVPPPAPGPSPGPKETPGRKKKKADLAAVHDQLFGASAEEWILDKNVPLGLDQLEINVGVERGQVRQLQESIFQERLRDMELVPPDKPIEVIVWNQSLADTSMSQKINLTPSAFPLPQP